MPDEPKQYAERPLEVIAGHVITSELVPLDQAGEDCRNPCGHIGVKHEDCWPFSIVSCLVCGTGMGVA